MRLFKNSRCPGSGVSSELSRGASEAERRRSRAPTGALSPPVAVTSVSGIGLDVCMLLSFGDRPRSVELFTGRLPGAGEVRAAAAWEQGRREGSLDFVLAAPPAGLLTSSRRRRSLLPG